MKRTRWLLAALLMALTGPALAVIDIADFVLVNVRTGEPLGSPTSCGWGECGMRVQRDTVGKTGGSFANTESPFVVWNRIGAGMRGREFSSLTMTESFQDSGEAVSSYLLTTKRGRAPAWAGVFELQDNENKEGAAIGIEVDVFTTGPATNPDDGLTSNGGRMRVGVDIVGGDQAIKNGGASSGATASLGFNVYATANTPDFRWLHGGQIRDYARTGLRLIGSPMASGWKPERAIDLQGPHVVGIDFSRGDFQEVVRLREGQAYGFDSYGDRIMRYKNGRLEIMHLVPKQGGGYEHKAVVAIDYSTGEIRAKRFVTTETP